MTDIKYVKDAFKDGKWPPKIQFGHTPMIHTVLMATIESSVISGNDIVLSVIHEDIRAHFPVEAKDPNMLDRLQELAVSAIGKTITYYGDLPLE